MLGTDVRESRNRQARRKASCTASSASAGLPRIRHAVRNDTAYPSSSQSSSRCSTIPPYDATERGLVRAVPAVRAWESADPRVEAVWLFPPPAAATGAPARVQRL